MVHRLSKPGNTTNAVGLAPMVVALRYRCACGDKELLQIQSVFSSNVSEEMFLITMKDLWRDMQTEIRQHLRDQS